MSGLGAIWGAVSALRVACYRNGLLAVRDLGRPTISIGALEMGGTGKTPTTAALARLLRDAGRRVAVLSRGYGRESREPLIVGLGEGPLVEPQRAGDEPYGYARALERVAVAVAGHREHAAELLAGRFEADLFLLDDGFQHVRVGRDLDLLVVDGDRPFWRDSPPPTGRLREAPSAAGRADAFVVTGSRFEDCRHELGRRFPGRPVFGMRREYPGAIVFANWRGGGAPTAPRPTRALAFAGIARPERFFASLETGGIEIVERRSFPDHHWYSGRDLEQLAAAARAAGAAMITTEKDAVRLDGLASVPDGLFVWPQRLVPHAGQEILAWVERRLPEAGS